MATTGNRGRSASRGRARRPTPMRPTRGSSSSNDSPRPTIRAMQVQPRFIQARAQRRFEQHNNRRQISASVSGSENEDASPIPASRVLQIDATNRRSTGLAPVLMDLDDSRLEPGNETYMRDSFVTTDNDDDESTIDSDSDDSDDHTRLHLLRPFVRDDSSFPNSDDDDDYDDHDNSEVLEPPSEPNDPTVIRSSEHGQCTICLEDAPYDPVGCLICRQLIGCRKCIQHWYRTGIKKRTENSKDAKNHFQCPLCRHNWEGQPEICSIFDLD